MLIVPPQLLLYMAVAPEEKIKYVRSPIAKFALTCLPKHALQFYGIETRAYHSLSPTL